MVMRQMMMCRPCMLKELRVFKIIIIYVIFCRIIGNEKLGKDDGSDDDVYILHVKRYTIRTCVELGR
jgi:hypothetical protein